MLARPVFPGRTYLISRRCADRRFFLRPGKKVNQILRYEALRVAAEHRVQLHAIVFMSNHVHLVVTDTRGVLPRFMEEFSRETAKAVSAEIGRWGGLWAPGSYSRVELLDPDRIAEAIAYVIANPVSAGLVRRARRWPGVSTVLVRFGDVMHARRPKARYYRNSGKSESVSLELSVPAGMDPIELEQDIHRRVGLIERETAARLAREGRKFIGEKTILSQDPYDSPTSWEKRRGRNPTFASTDKWKRIEAAQRKREWYASYRAALEKFRQGVRDTVFPAGTWMMARVFGCRCEPLAAPG